MKRATVLGLGTVFAAALRAPAGPQEAGRVYRVGILSGTTISATAVRRDALVRALAGIGYREGQNLELVVRDTGGDYSRADALANELVRAKPDVIVAAGSAVISVLKKATTSIPIVMIEVGDPVGSGFVASLARPGGNITGATIIEADLTGKRMQLLTELVPNTRRVALLNNPNNPAKPAEARQFLAACRALGIVGFTVDVRSARDVDGALRGLLRQHANALLVETDGMLISYGQRIVEQVATLRLPAMYGLDLFPGGLVTYGPSGVGQWVLAATYVDRILKGAKPADLPVQQPTTFDLVVNLKTAHALGLTVPQSILLQATQVIR